MSAVLSVVAGLISGTLGALGLGGGSVLILYLTIFMSVDQRSAQGINLIFFIPCALIAIFLHSRKKLICWKLWLISAPVGVIGAFLGSYIASLIDSSALSKVFAVLLFIFGCSEIFHKRKPTNKIDSKSTSHHSS